MIGTRKYKMYSHASSMGAHSYIRTLWPSSLHSCEWPSVPNVKIASKLVDSSNSTMTHFRSACGHWMGSRIVSSREQIVNPWSCALFQVPKSKLRCKSYKKPKWRLSSLFCRNNHVSPLKSCQSLHQEWSLSTLTDLIGIRIIFIFFGVCS